MPSRFAFRAALLIVALAGVGCGPARQLAVSGPTMGTQYVVRVADPPASVSEQQVRATITAILARIDSSMSGYRVDSEISRFNAAVTTEWIEVSADLANVVAAAAVVSEQSQGALDLTVAPLVNLWGFGQLRQRSDVPSSEEVRQTRAHVGFDKLAVRLQPPALRKDDPQLTVDLNAVAPGYAVDLLHSALADLGLVNFLIDIGGEVRARGHARSGRPWRIAVEKPVDAAPEPYAILQLADRAVATSGNYRHYEVRAGTRYSHTIDPRSGRPVEHDLAAVVVVSSTALLADAWATALNVLGESAGYALADQHQLPVMFITRRHGEWQKKVTPGFEQYLISGPVSN